VSDSGNDGQNCSIAANSDVGISNKNRDSDSPSGYNSSDEYERLPEMWSKDEWDEKERHFELGLMQKGLKIKKMGEDGACLFRAVGM
jgi:OTU domain-containing protein 5